MMKLMVKKRIVKSHHKKQQEIPPCHPVSMATTKNFIMF